MNLLKVKNHLICSLFFSVSPRTLSRLIYRKVVFLLFFLPKFNGNKHLKFICAQIPSGKVMGNSGNLLVCHVALRTRVGFHVFSVEGTRKDPHNEASFMSTT